jgi:glutamate-5-semialdehyde dehydrogenase
LPMATTTLSVTEICTSAQHASRVLATLPSSTKDGALEAVAQELDRRSEEILEANSRDVEAAQSEYPAAFVDKLTLNPARLAGMIAGVRAIVALPDPVGEVIDGRRLPNGLDIRRVRVPLGVVGVVYEARPNVTIDAAALCLKAGNAIVLRGSSAATGSNAVLADVVSVAATGAGLPQGCVSLLPGGDRRAGHAVGSGGPARPARGRGAEGIAQGRGHRPRDLCRIGQLSRLR